MKKNTRIRALYIGDVRFNSCPVFELNLKTMNFEMLSDPTFAYSIDIILYDSDFILFTVEWDHAKKLSKANFRKMKKEF